MEDTTAEMNYVNPNVKVPPLKIPKATEKTEEEHPATCMEKAFMFAGFYAAHHPWKHIFISTLVCCALGSGFFTVLEAENRPEKQWVPAGAPALEQKDYVDATW